ncbi:MAG: hypothetical protein WBX05_09845 [Pseudolabrys sp.]
MSNFYVAFGAFVHSDSGVHAAAAWHYSVLRVSALLWYFKPRGDLWLIGSLIGGAYIPHFLWAITRQI